MARVRVGNLYVETPRKSSHSISADPKWIIVGDAEYDVEQNVLQYRGTPPDMRIYRKKSAWHTWFSGAQREVLLVKVEHENVYSTGDIIGSFP